MRTVRILISIPAPALLAELHVPGEKNSLELRRAVLAESALMAAMTRLTPAQAVMTEAMGTAVPLWRVLTKADVTAPAAIWRLPIRADALPAFFEKCSMARPMALGSTRPKQKA